MVAINRSRGESMIRQPTTPQALQPNPIAMVDCYLDAETHSEYILDAAVPLKRK